jgi:hypothetical protein
MNCTLRSPCDYGLDGRILAADVADFKSGLQEKIPRSVIVAFPR